MEGLVGQTALEWRDTLSCRAPGQGSVVDLSDPETGNPPRLVWFYQDQSQSSATNFGNSSPAFAAVTDGIPMVYIGSDIGKFYGIA